jgi:glycerate kinase
MKIVIAPDSFKDSLSAQAVAQAIARGVQTALPDAERVLCPMADGGEGTVEAILAVVAGERRSAEVSGPLRLPVTARWGWLPETRTAIIEMAEASGLQLVPLQARDACHSCTFGTGQLILHAMDAGAKHIILTVGGSATNDGGAGMLKALGARFVDFSGSELPPGGTALAELASLDLSQLDACLAGIKFTIAADVDNPLCGAHGASAVFGPQKGATLAHVQALDHALGHFADCAARVLERDLRAVPGAGAAGGMGFAALAFLDAQLRPGVDVVAELVGLAEKVRGADLVITGEGRCDAQTLRGKTPMGVARVAQQHQVPVVILAGTLGEGYQALYEHGVLAAFSVVPGPMGLAQACDGAAALLEAAAGDVLRVWAQGR